MIGSRHLRFFSFGINIPTHFLLFGDFDISEYMGKNYCAGEKGGYININDKKSNWQ